MNNRKTFVLAEWNWQGHHPTYFNYFVLALEELGFNVLALCADPVEAARNAGQLRKKNDSSAPAPGRTEFRKIEVAGRRFHHLRPARIGAMDWTIRHFTGIERQAQAWARESGTKTDAIFYACIYDWDFEWVRYAQPFLRLPWVGLYLHAMSFRMPGQPDSRTGKVPFPEKMFNGKLCKGIAILDEGITRQVSEAIRKPIVVLPDVTDGRLPADGNEQALGQRLKQFAAGRPIIGLFGHLQKSKGILTFLEAARLPAASNLCFALGGEMLWPSDRFEANAIQTTLEECLNVWNHLARIHDPTLNGLLAVCDVVCASYRDFPHSSNILTKAAILKKPVIVSDGYLMAERVKRYHTGEIIPQDNPQALLDAIFRITKDPARWVADHKPGWDDYRQENTFERFKSALGQLLSPL